MEHGSRIELRELVQQPRRGSESAAQLITVDRPLFRADLFDSLADEPGSYRVAHFHPEFSGNEPCPRVWDASLTASPWDWLHDQVESVGAVSSRPAWPLDPADARELSSLADTVVTMARTFAPERCRAYASPTCWTRSGYRPGARQPRSGGPVGYPPERPSSRAAFPPVMASSTCSRRPPLRHSARARSIGKTGQSVPCSTCSLSRLFMNRSITSQPVPCSQT